MKIKTLSVIIPVYNAEKYLSECIESVLNQEGVNCEIICIDDGSKDNGAEIISDYVKKNDNVKLYSQKNRGLSYTRNRGVDLATGEYIYFLDADDKLAGNNVFQELIHDITQDNLDIIEFDAQSFFETDELKKGSSGYEKMYRRDYSYGFFLTGKELFYRLFEEQKYYTSACLRLYRREFLMNNKLRFPEGILYEDNFFTLACYIKAKNVIHKNNTIMLRRVRAGSITQKQMMFKNFISYVKLYQAIIELWKNNNEEELTSYFYKICEDIKRSAKEAYYSISYEEKEKIKVLDPSFRYLIESDVLRKLDDPILYAFPYHLFYPDQKLWIYGAGKVGKLFYKIAKEDCVVEVEGIVDQRAGFLSDDEIFVQGIEVISEHKDSTWLIAIEDETLANDAKKVLCEFGVSEKDILWDGYAYRNRSIPIKMGMRKKEEL